MKDYYSILMVHPRAELFVIESAYKRLAREYHPDVSGADNSHELMVEINEAYEVLSDNERKRKYDSQYFIADIGDTAQRRDEKEHEGPEFRHTRSSVEGSIDALILKAHVLIRGNNFPPAISLLKRAYELNPYDRRVEMMLKDAKRTWGQILIRNQQ